MKSQETVSNAALAPSARITPDRGRVHRSAKYQKVLDGRKQPIRGLWVRNDRYVARITAEDASGKKGLKWVPLEKAETVAQAQAELRKLLTKRDHSELPVLGVTPK